MIHFLTGVIGGGKTYFAMNYIVKNFLKDDLLRKKIDKRFELEKKDYCLTNINEIKKGKFDNLIDLDFRDFYNHLTELHALYKNGATDTELNKVATEYNLSNVLIVLDEAQNFLDKKDDVLVWWLSYARHLYHEVILITQNLSLIDAKYKAFSEHFYKALPASLRMFKNVMKYNQYIDTKMYNTQKSGVIKVKINKFIFDLYGSGNNANSSSILMKFALIAVGFVVAFILVILVIRSFWTSSEPETKQDRSAHPKQHYKVVHYSKQDTRVAKSTKKTVNKIITIKCNDSVCMFEDKIFPLMLVQSFLDQDDTKIIKRKKQFIGLHTYIIDTSKKTKKAFFDGYYNTDQDKEKDSGRVSITDSFSF